MTPIAASLAAGWAGAWGAAWAALVVGPVQFDRPVWLWLIVVTWAWTLLVARRSLAGGGTALRWTALGVRLVVLAALACVLAEPQRRNESEEVSVTVVLDASESVPAAVQTEAERYVESAAAAGRRASSGRKDRLGVVTAAKDAFVQSLPSPETTVVERQHVGALDGTDLSKAIRLALAIRPPDAANRLVLASDGNETAGNLLRAGEAAKAAGVPIDILPLKYRYADEVLVDRLVAPATAREGDTVGVRVVLQATRATRGRINISMNGEPVDLDPDSPAMGQLVDVPAGLQVFSVPVKIPRPGPHVFEAVFEPLTRDGRLCSPR